jgi:exoribonuclease R
VPMFPSVLAEGLFSLDNPGLCKTVTLSGTVGPDGALQSGEVTLGLATSTRITYDIADAHLRRGEPESAVAAATAALAGDAISPPAAEVLQVS